MSGCTAVEVTEQICVQNLMFAGRPLLLETNSPSLARYAAGFLPGSTDVLDGAAASAKITLIARAPDRLSNYMPGCEPAEATWFRARGYFVFARFSSSDTLWMNLRTREVYGDVSAELADDAERWHRQIFPAILGVLSATIDVAPVHAACLVREGAGILLSARSGVGKSTLSVALAKRGFAHLADDWTYLSASGDSIVAWGLPVPVKLLPDASRFFPELEYYDPHVSLNGEVAYEVSLESCFEVARETHCKIARVVLLERSQTPGCIVTEIDSNEAVQQLVSEIEPLEGPLRDCYLRQVSLIRRLKDVVCLRVAFNDTPGNVARILDHTFSRLS